MVTASKASKGLALDPADLQANRTMRRIEGLRVVLQKVLRVMSNSGVWLHLGKPRAAQLRDVAGWTNGKDVTINRLVVEQSLEGVAYNDPRFAEVVAAFKGVCYHELGHILYSPRATTKVGMGVRDLAMHDPMYWYAYNGLEDQRQETLFVGRYGPTEPYFQRMINEWVVKTPEGLVVAHSLLWGRRYLPLNIRLGARKVFEAQYSRDLGNRFAKVIDEYCDLVFDGSVIADTKGLDCVKRYKQLLELLKRQLPPQPSMDNTPTDPNGMTDGENAITKGKADPKKQEEAQKGADEQLKEKEQEKEKADKERQEGKRVTDDPHTDPDDDDDDVTGEDEGDSEAGDDEGDDEDEPGFGEPCKDGEPGDGGEETDGAEGQGEGDADAEGDAEGEGDGDGDEFSDSEAGGDAGGKGADKSSNPEGTPETANDLYDAAKEALDDIMADPDLQQDVQDTIDAIRASVQGSDGLGGMETPSTPESPVSEARTVVRKILRDLQVLRLEQEPMKEHRQTSGRINMRRALSADETDMDIFDRWNTELEEAGGIETVILLDLSGSMQGRMELISQMMWSIKTSMDRLDIPCTVLGYSDNWNVLYRPREKAKRNTVRLFNSIGGTIPFFAIREAHRLLIGSDCPNRVLVSITDGAWQAHGDGGGWSGITGNVVDAEIKPYMDDLHANGTSSLLIGVFNPDPSYYDRKPVETYGKHLHELAFDTADLSMVPVAIGKLVKSILTKVNAAHHTIG
jgi:hypothetical protein